MALCRFYCVAMVAAAHGIDAFAPSLLIARHSALSTLKGRFPSSNMRSRAVVGPVCMAGAGGKAVTLDESGFNKFDESGVGDADPIGSIEALNKVVPRAKITALIKQTSDAEGFKQVLWQAGCYAVCAAAFTASNAMAIAPLSVVSMLAMSLVMSFNFMALHETVHRSAFKSRVWNDVFMHVAGFLTMRPALHYFYYHWAHHKFTGNPDMDSELIPSALDMDVSTWTGYVLYISGLPFWFDAITTTIKHAMGKCPEHYLAADKAKQEITTEARVYGALYLGLLAASVVNPAFGMGFLMYAVLPSMLGQPFLRFYLMAEHRGCQESTNVLENTRTMNTNWFIRQMAWQMPYHLEHHAWPYVPFHKLAEANKLVVNSGGWSQESCAPTGEKGYAGLNKEIFNSLILKPTV